MSSELLLRRFAAIGAQLDVTPGPWRGAASLDVRDERFVLGFAGSGEPSDAEVVQVAPADRHLLLLVRSAGAKSRFLCGHDERHWFVAAVPETARGVTGVRTAKAALQPPAVAELAARLPQRRRFRRRTPAFVRQGEWFFVPEPGLRVRDAWVLRNEPVARAGGTPHILREAYRRGGETVYVHAGRTNVLSPSQYAKLSPAKRRHWVARVRNPELFARGTVRHPDHATVALPGWHRVLMNTEHEALAMRHVVFID
jgi:hypothetical protein